jgi:uncharacterized protein YdhG (YjbR/CyaY superfamily)
MQPTRSKPEDIDTYIAGFPEDIQVLLEQVRATIKNPAPDAEETINHQIPTFSLYGNLVHFAAFKKHIGFYPTHPGIERYEHELSAYETAKGSVKFPINEPIPLN